MTSPLSGSPMGLFFLGLFLALGLFFSSMEMSKTFEKVKRSQETVKVKGFAEQPLVSDLGVWEGKFTSREKDLKKAYEKLENDQKIIIAFLEKHGIQDKDIDFSSISTQIVYQKNDKGIETNLINGYILDQNLKIHSEKTIERKN